MEWVDVIILSLLQGITEFLPISASAHLIFVRDWLAIDIVNQLALDAMIHFAGAGAVILYFWSDVWGLLQVLMRRLGRLPVNEKDIMSLYALAIGTIPILILGLILDTYVLEHPQTVLVIASLLAVSSIFFMYTEWQYYLRPTHGELTLKRGWAIGWFQILALLPAMSRTGITIIGGMLLGMTRYDATRFSFFLAIPVLFGIGTKRTMSLLNETTGSIEWTMVGAGAVISFLVSLLAIHYFLRFIRKNTLWPFAWYGIILAGMMWYVEIFT